MLKITSSDGSTLSSDFLSAPGANQLNDVSDGLSNTLFLAERRWAGPLGSIPGGLKVKENNSSAVFYDYGHLVVDDTAVPDGNAVLPKNPPTTLYSINSVSPAAKEPGDGNTNRTFA